MRQGTRIGIMGGTFDPIHNGHLAIAKSAAEQLGLQRVLFMPTGNPHFKLDQHVTDAHHRAQMIERAIESESLFELDMREVERGGVTYTADTLEEMSAEDPDAQLFFFLGTDSALTLPKWRRAQDVAKLCTIAVLHRPGESTQAARDVLAAGSIEFDAVFLDVPQVDVSSTQVREQAMHDQPIDDMVPPAVAQYIDQMNLYRHPSSEEAT